MADEDTLLQYTDKYSDSTVESVFVRKTTDEAYPSGYKYSFHFGTTDGRTIVRYDNAHEETKGHERHTLDGVELIEFPGIETLYERFLREVEASRS